MRKSKLVFLTIALAATSLAWAQDSAKDPLVKQYLELQRPDIEAFSRLMVERSTIPLRQQGAAYLQTQVPQDKRQGLAQAAAADLEKYTNNVYPTVRDRAVADAPTTIGPVLQKNFSADELRQINNWLNQVNTWQNSSLGKKYLEVYPQMQRALEEKVVSETTPMVRQNLEALAASMTKTLGIPQNPPAANTPAKGKKK
ncbi:MAG: hypothetical protein LBV61_01645 [Burkholderiaceae bacterium]|jgi:hypothetical protein|nr:hypothetical protein [Burkholderiaceae bacterium]